MGVGEFRGVQPALVRGKGSPLSLCNNFRLPRALVFLVKVLRTGVSPCQIGGRAKTLFTSPIHFLPPGEKNTINSPCFWSGKTPAA